MTAFPKLFQPGQIGKLPLKNHVVMPAMGVSLARTNGEASDDIIRYYAERARGGVGLIITEVTRIDDKTGVATFKQLAVTDPKQIPQLQRLADAVHKYDTKIFVQLHHPGRETTSQLLNGTQIVGPSAIADKTVKEVPRALSTEEVQALVKAFIKGAVIAKTAGIDGVEIHAAHGYLINEFLSPYSNQRTDRYGGSFHNRLRFLQEIIAGIKYMCGADFPISVRISADEFVAGGLKIADSVKIARTLESYGIDAINVSSGIYESAPTIIEPGSYAQAWKKGLAKAIKANVSIPVIAVNNIKTPEVAEQLLNEDVCDYIGVARANLCDPDWTRKAAAGQSDQITTCIGCLICFEAMQAGKHIICAVNPRLGREREFAALNRNGQQRTVAVIGGGPGGMTAARTLAERDFKVALFEQDKVLGGTLNIADKPPLKDKLTLLNQQLTNQVEANKNITIHLNEKATVEKIQALQPAGVFVASGAKPIIPQLPGMGGKNVITAEAYLSGQAKVTGKVAIIGGSMTGLETAEKLAGEGHDVTIIEMLAKVGTGVNPTILIDLMQRLNKYQPTILTGKRLIGAGEHGVKVLDMINHGMADVAADTVILALGVTPNTSISAPFSAAFAATKIIGDAQVGGRIAEAMRDGYTKAYVFDND
ncbi:NAD(P)/FAD-dependent oxidoreductase [Loigolactobacillus binensis]|uniref:FAD-dependent oxidoreductase n=1 Tax=Loigolactobacillus binensis TaxID=2559922 RepID=A0ABW3EFA9_9LACO|nr:NAD(P)/FAD-dependent oxidoreductase [Loigolactobacillus binensis]